MDNLSKRLINKLILDVEKLFEKEGQIIPMCLILNKEGEITFVPTMCSNEIEKDIIHTKIIPQTILKHKGITSFLITEAWSVSLNKDEKIIKPASQYSNRQENVMIVLETLSDRLMYKWNIIRKEGQEPYIERHQTFISDISSNDSEGRCSDYFKIIKSIMN